MFLQEPLASLHGPRARTAGRPGRDRRPRDVRGGGPAPARDAVGGQPADPGARVRGRPGRRASYDAVPPDPGRRGAAPAGPADPAAARRGARRRSRTGTAARSTCRSPSTPTRWRPGSAASLGRGGGLAGRRAPAARRGPGVLRRPAAQRRRARGRDLRPDARSRAARSSRSAACATCPAATPEFVERWRRGRGPDWAAMPMVVFNEKDALQHDVLGGPRRRRATRRAPGADVGATSSRRSASASGGG